CATITTVVVTPFDYW
nr:immunoglobulin heavy chain junction region [Mus musculus]